MAFVVGIVGYTTNCSIPNIPIIRLFKLLMSGTKQHVDFSLYYHLFQIKSIYFARIMKIKMQSVIQIEEQRMRKE